jgi:hypothetical protein
MLRSISLWIPILRLDILYCAVLVSRRFSGWSILGHHAKCDYGDSALGFRTTGTSGWRILCHSESGEARQFPSNGFPSERRELARLISLFSRGPAG